MGKRAWSGGWPDTVCWDSPNPALQHSQEQEHGHQHIPAKPFPRETCREGSLCAAELPWTPGRGSPRILKVSERFSAQQRLFLGEATCSRRNPSGMGLILPRDG